MPPPLPLQSAVLPGCLAATDPLPPHYPEDLLSAGVAGKVMLAVTIDYCGVPVAVRVHETSGNQLLDGSAIKAAYTWRFRVPPDGRVADGIILVPVNFDPTK